MDVASTWSSGQFSTIMESVGAFPMSTMSLDAYRSPSDKKSYRLITLENGLEALLIHSDLTCDKEAEDEPEDEPFDHHRDNGYDTDSDSEEDDSDDDRSRSDSMSSVVSKKGARHAAACLSVGVGSLADPVYLHGLAHYVEHMLFMGSRKYPNENEFESFLSTHGGSSNGCTECESTQYEFEVAPRHLEKALDMFAQFFIAPLFQNDAMTRELSAIESEFNRAQQNDYVRLQQVHSATSCGLDEFGWGNMISLKTEPEKKGINVREEMLTFYHTQYSSHRMKLTVLGDDSLDDMERWVRSSFSAIPYRPHVASPLPRTLSQPFGVAAQQPPTLIRMIPVRNIHAMHIYWPLPCLYRHYQQKPWEYLSHVMGHEGRGSLSTKLRVEKEWATQLTAGISEYDGYEFSSFGSLFEIHITLTENGFTHWKHVMEMVFECLGFLLTDGFHSWIFDELKNASRMHFQYLEEQEPSEQCKRWSELMQTRRGIDRTMLLSYDVLCGTFDVSITRELLEKWMTPDNTRIVLMSPTLTTIDHIEWKTERWTGVSYTHEVISQELIEQWNTLRSQPRIAFSTWAQPTPNPFFPSSFTILPISEDNKTLPQLILSTPRTKLWYKRDVKFLIPKVNIHFLLCLPSITSHVEYYIYTKLYIRLVEETLQEIAYQSTSAHLSFELSLRDLDLEMTFHGFNASLPILIQAVVNALMKTTITISVLSRVREEMIKEYRNMHLKPSVKARYMRLQLLEHTTFSIDEKMQVLMMSVEELKDEMQHYVQHILWSDEGDRKAAIRGFIHGNMRQEQAQEISLVLEQALISAQDQRMEIETLLSPRRPFTTTLPLSMNGLLLRASSQHVEEPNSHVEIYYQLYHSPTLSLEKLMQDHAYLELLQQIMNEPLFNTLRTQQQLGYEVYCTVRETHGVLGFSIAVQSASHGAGEIAIAIDQFVEQTFYRFLQEEMTDTLFSQHVASVRRIQSRQDANLNEETNRFWEEIQTRRLAFNYDELILQALETCRLQEFIQRYQTWLLSGVERNEQVRKLRVHVIGQRAKRIKPLETLVDPHQVPVLIENLAEFKKTLKCHPHTMMKKNSK